MISPGGRDDFQAQPRSELGLRAASGVVMAVVALATTWLGGGVFAALWLAAGIAIAIEWIAMTRAEPRLPLSIGAGLGLAALVLAVRLDGPLPVTLGIGGVTLVALAVTARGAASRNWAISGFGYAAVVALVPIVVRDRPELGALAILWIFAVVWTTDIAAYFVGRRLGGPKLWARVSPKKTWSGFVGGVAGAILAGTAVAAFGQKVGAEPPFGLAVVALLSALASVASQGGDLAESALKRRCAVKDSGRLIPGHGGVMDRLDGFFAVALLVGLAIAGSRVVVR